jgi:NADH dehydrogenase
MYLIGFKNRLTTMLHWAVSFLFRGRSQRTTTRQQIVARTLMARLSAVEEELNQTRAGDAADPVDAAVAEGEVPADPGPAEPGSGGPIKEAVVPPQRAV